MSTKEDTEGRFTAETTMIEALTADPQLGALLIQDFHLGGCQSCAFNPHDTIEQIAKSNGIPTEQLLDALNKGN